LVEIVGDDGLSGWGEGYGPPVLTAPIIEFYKSLLVNADAFATELHWRTSTTGCATMARRDWP
jgi:L-alanine-DL-glutamate epimerase-like enolase superfamily enzyme